jgi:hypothetical protein
MKTFRHYLQEEFAKEGFIIPGMPRSVDEQAFHAVFKAAKFWLKDKYRYKTGFQGYEKGYNSTKRYIRNAFITELSKEIDKELGIDSPVSH